MAKDATRAVYAGMLVKAEAVSVTFAEVPYRANEGARHAVPLGLQAIKSLANKAWPIDSGRARAAVRAAADYIITACPEVRGIGVATYGPLGSVDVRDRDVDCSDSATRRERELRRAMYGRVRDTSVHASLRGLPVYEIVQDVVAVRGATSRTKGEANIWIHTDVMCGAMYESLLRQETTLQRSTPRKYRQLEKTDGLVFLHLAEGLGGAYVVGNRPYTSALHPEVGYATPQILPEDPLAERALPIWFETVASSTALKARAKGKSIPDIPPHERAWVFEAHYVAQLCATLTKALAPHQIVLHGPVIDQADAAVGFLERVREAFPFWMDGRLEYEAMQHETYIDVALALSPMLSGAVVLGSLKSTDLEDALVG